MHHVHGFDDACAAALRLVCSYTYAVMMIDVGVNCQRVCVRICVYVVMFRMRGRWLPTISVLMSCVVVPSSGMIHFPPSSTQLK